MAHNHNDIYSIVERLRVLEEGLDKNQRSVNQLGPTFKPKTVAVLTAKTDPKNPMAGKLVGGAESKQSDKKPVEEAMATEDVLEKVKKSFTDFIRQAEESIDKEVQEKKQEDTDLKKKERKDRDLIAKATPVAEDPTEDDPETAAPATLSPQAPKVNPTLPESKCVKSITMEDGKIFEIHGNEHDGFEVRHSGRSMKSKFENLDHAVMAVEMFRHRMKKNDLSQDYMEEK